MSQGASLRGTPERSHANILGEEALPREDVSGALRQACALQTVSWRVWEGEM